MSPRPSGEGWYERRPRLPGPGAPRREGRRSFGATWWGRAWVESLEQRARLDPNRLPRGRTYARSGAVGPLTLAPGEIAASVQGSRPAPYKVRVRVRAFEANEWERVLDALSLEIGHTAALLDGEIPAGVAHDVHAVGLDLLPGAGELQPRCSCPDWADPCKHAAAVCYLVADAVDADPFGVFLLRGRSREELLAGLRSRRQLAAPATDIPASAKVDPGIPAKEAFSRRPAPMPAPAPPPGRAGQPVVLAADPPAGSGIDLVALRALASDAARRALALLQGATSTGHELDANEDLARRAATLVGRDAGAGEIGLAELARRAGLPGRELLRRALAYHHGGVAGLAALEDSFDPGPAAAAAGRALLGSDATVRRNRVTLGARQLRLGRDGRWYPFAKDGTGRWVPEGPPLVGESGEEIGVLGEDA